MYATRADIDQCSDCFGAIFHAFHVPPTYAFSVDQFYDTFFRHCAEEQSKAIRNGSSIYAAAERFIQGEGNESVMVTFYAVPREEYNQASSPAAQRPTATQTTATQDDLMFDHVITSKAVELHALDDPLHYQYITRYLTSTRVTQALWDLSRLPPGSHHAGSKTFVWLQRQLIFR
jgi:hypothetical protein